MLAVEQLSQFLTFKRGLRSVSLRKQQLSLIKTPFFPVKIEYMISPEVKLE